MKSEGVEPTNVERYYIYTHQSGSSSEERRDSVLFPFYRILFSETLLYHVKLECQELSSGSCYCPRRVSAYVAVLKQRMNGQPEKNKQNYHHPQRQNLRPTFPETGGICLLAASSFQMRRFTVFTDIPIKLSNFSLINWRCHSKAQIQE